MGRAVQLVVSCEHGGNRIPARYGPLFAGQRATLDSHAGYDIGALAVARDIAATLADAVPTSLVYATASRLLVDLNRSVGHPRLHGTAIRGLPPAARASIVRRYHAPYRERVRRAVAQAVDGGRRVVHVSCHSFSPSLGGKVRDADIGLLFDPGRAKEVVLARQWRAALWRAQPALRIRMNFPYRGTADGVTTALRREFRGADYLGIELEVNQIHPTANGRRWRALRRLLAETLVQALGIGAAGPPSTRPTKPPGGGMERPA